MIVMIAMPTGIYFSVAWRFYEVLRWMKSVMLSSLEKAEGIVVITSCRSTYCVPVLYRIPGLLFSVAYLVFACCA